MENESKIESDQMQRLVDGELSAEEIRALFGIAEQNPEHWRMIACAFAEDQLFAKQFESLTAHIDTKPVRPAKSTKAIVRPTSSPTRSPSKPPIKTATQSMPLMKRWAIAASLAVAGIVGYMVGSDGPIAKAPVSTNMIAEYDSQGDSGSDSKIAQTPAMTSVDLQPECSIELLTPDGESVDGEVDLYRYNDLYQFVENGSDDRKVTLNNLMPPSGFSAEARQRLSQSGYEINESTNYMSGRLQDGRQFVVPVRSIRFDQGH